MEETEIEFKGKKYLLIGNLENGGAIATREAYENFECSYAHLHPDGKVHRFDLVIGSRDDIKVLGEIEVNVVASLDKIWRTIINLAEYGWRNRET